MGAVFRRVCSPSRGLFPGGKLGLYGVSPFRYGHKMVPFFFLPCFVIRSRCARQFSAPVSAAVRIVWDAFVWRRARRLCPTLQAAVELTMDLACALHLGIEKLLLSRARGEEGRGHVA